MPPIAKIGEAGWKDSLQDYLQNYEIDCQGVDLGVIEAQEKKLDIKLPEVIQKYYLNFGNTDSSDFMYGLKKIEELILLFAANITFVPLHFKMYEIITMVYFANTPGNALVCFDKDSGDIYVFSHDSIRKAKVFKD